MTAFTIDARRGDLWVVSAAGEGSSARSTLHKLQLVSGRALLQARPAARAGAVHLVGVTVTPDGTVYAVDAGEARLFRLRPGSRSLEPVMRVGDAAPVAVAAADERTLYIATAKGLLRVDLSAQTSSAVKSVEDLSGFESLTWRAGSLVGIERVAGSYLVVRVKLDPSGTRAQPRQILAASPDAIVGALAGSSFFYVSDSTVRRLTLR